MIKSLGEPFEGKLAPIHAAEREHRLAAGFALDRICSASYIILIATGVTDSNLVDFV